MYNSWLGMRNRCSNPKNRLYKYYGGRGIVVCERWNSFDNFLADMGVRPDGLTLERINNDGNYEPNNCKWATMAEQNRNRRRWAKPKVVKPKVVKPKPDIVFNKYNNAIGNLRADNVKFISFADLATGFDKLREQTQAELVSEQIEDEIKRKDAGLTTVKDSLIRIDNLTEKQAEEKAKEIEEENKIEMPQPQLGNNPFNKMPN